MRLAVVCSHPIQYYSPWFRFLAKTGIVVKVFYLWEFGVAERMDRGFGHSLQWDVPLLDGYQHEFVPNTAADPGTHHFWGLQNGSLGTRVCNFAPDAVLMIGYNYASLIRLMLTARLRRIPFLLKGDSHRLAENRGMRASIKAILRGVIFRRFAAVLYAGKANRAYFLASGVPEARLFSSPHAVDNQRFFEARASGEKRRAGWREELGFSEQDVVFLFAGKFEAKKRPDLLLESFMGISEPKAKLLFVGAGHLEKVLKAKANSDSRVRFLPFQNQSQMPAVYALADVLVLPSEGSGETWGLCVNEAMCMARPVIVSSHVGSAADLVSCGMNGLVFPSGDGSALRSALREMLARAVELPDMGRRSLQIIQSYSYETATRGLEEALYFSAGH